MKIAKVERVRLGVHGALVDLLVDRELAPMFLELLDEGLEVVRVEGDAGELGGVLIKRLDLTLVARPVPIDRQPTTRIEASDEHDDDNDPR